MLRNELNQDSKSCVYLKLQSIDEEFKSTQIKGKTFYAQELDKLILLKCPWYSRRSIDSIHSPSKYK